MTSKPPPLPGNSAFMSQTLSGTAIGNAREKHITEKYIPFDIQITREVSLVHFLEAFGVYLNDLVERKSGIEWITSDPGNKALRDVYCKAASLSKVKRARYRSFIELVNTILGDLFKNQYRASNILARNDPHCLRGTRRVITKPGVAFELLCPIIDLDDLEEFKECFRGIFQGHHSLWTSGIHHRDISPTNLMYRRLPDNCIQGVLNDWDISELADSDMKPPLSRTGTLPFMAQDILVVNPPIHIERHDWESLLYVLIWIGCRYGSGGVVLREEVLSRWLEHDFDRLFDGKARIILRGCPPLTEHYEGLQQWIDPIIDLFASGVGALRRYKAARKATRNSMDTSQSFDHLSLGGHVTYAKLREIYWS